MGTALMIADIPENPLQVAAVLEAVTTGKTLTEIESQPEMPSKDIVIHWLLRNPELMQRFTAAREISGYTLEDEALSLLRQKAATGAAKPGDLKAIEMLVQQLRWSAEKRNPQVYARQGVVQVTVPIQINTSLDLAQGPGAGTKEHPDIYELQAVNVTDDPDADAEGKREGEAGTPAKGRRRKTAAQELYAVEHKRKLAREQKQRQRARRRAEAAERAARGSGIGGDSDGAASD